jgi:hypothetical protein
MAKVTIELADILALLRPPSHALQSVEKYQTYIESCLIASTSPRGPGRPSADNHPAYAQRDYRRIKSALLPIIKEHPELYRSSENVPAKGFHREQPDNPEQFRLDNGVVVELMSSVEPLDLTLPEVVITIPPGVIER